MREIELSSVITDIAAGPFGSNLKVECFVPSGFPIVDGANLKSYKVTDNITKFVTEKKARSLGRSIAKRGDVIVTISGTLGQISYIPDDSKYTEYLCSQRQFRVSFDESKVYAPYLVFYFHTYEGQNKILSFANQTGVPALSQPLKNFKKIRLQLPPLEQQKKIASVIEAINRKIEYNQKINDNLLEQASTLFNSAIQQSTSVVYAELGSLAEVKGGKRLPKGVNLVTTPNQHPYIRVRDLNNTVFASLSNDYEYVDDETQQSISRYTVSTGDLLISIVGTIGLTAIVDHTLNKANLTENCVKLTNIKNVTPEYLLLFLRSLQGVEAISKGTVGAVQLKLPIKNIQSVTVPLLCDEELQPLQETLSAIFSQISANIVEMKQLADIRDTLLPKLMSGELDVSSLDL